MANSYRQHYFHIIWSTKERKNLILPKIEQRLFPYIVGIARRQNCTLHEVNGTENHIHLLMQLSNLDEFSALIRTIKSCSTGFLKKEFPECQNFAWQDGYGSFTVSYSQFERVRSYIQNQKEHHKQSTFEDEYLKLLESHQINDEMKYVFG